MFGYLTADIEKLPEESFLRYRSAYCGLCRKLRERHGEAAGLTLNYDMTLLVLFLGSLYEPEEKQGEGKCLPHPRHARQWFQSEMTDYAADMNVALAYLKCLDDWEDDGNPASLAESALFKSAYNKIETQYPRQCRAIREALDALHALEKENSEDIDAAASCFGRLMAEIFVYREDRWSGTVRAFAASLGKFIYVMDACMDLDADTIRNRYNPFRRYYGLENEQRFRDILRMILGECVYHFDILPLVQDADIMKNILCDGLWQQFNKKYKIKEASDVSGSV